MRILFLAIFFSLNALAHDTQYAVKGKLNRGEKATVICVELETFNNARVNPEAPLSLEITAMDGMQLPKTKFSRDDFSVLNNNTLRFEIESKNALQKLEAHMIFYLCFKNTCKKIDHNFTLR